MAFVQYLLGDFNLHQDQPTDAWAAASKFAFRTGNPAVGSKFDPAKNWSARIIAQLALLVTEPQTDALVRPKPSTQHYALAQPDGTASRSGAGGRGAQPKQSGRLGVARVCRALVPLLGVHAGASGRDAGFSLGTEV